MCVCECGIVCIVGERKLYHKFVMNLFVIHTTKQYSTFIHMHAYKYMCMYEYMNHLIFIVPGFIFIAVVIVVVFINIFLQIKLVCEIFFSCRHRCWFLCNTFIAYLCYE